MRLTVLCFSLCFSYCISSAQALLPHITVISKNGKNVVSWANGYKGIRQIALQRSQDSLFNYATFGYAHNPNANVNSFTDDKPPAGTNFYRLFIEFTTDTYFFSDPSRVVYLQAQPAGQAAENAQLASTAFVPSIYVYTNSDGNVNISLSDAARNHYRLAVFDSDNKKVFEIDDIKQPLLIIDKSNFLHSGWFSFRLFENDRLKEHYKFFIPDQWGKN